MALLMSHTFYIFFNLGFCFRAYCNDAVRHQLLMSNCEVFELPVVVRNLLGRMSFAQIVACSISASDMHSRMPAGSRASSIS